MSFPRIQKVLDEYGLDIDDVRWFLSVQMAEELLAYQNEQIRLVEYIWNGTLSDRLFNLEESYLNSLEERWNSGKREEAHVREFMAMVRNSRRRRGKATPPIESPEASSPGDAENED